MIEILGDDTDELSFEAMSVFDVTSDLIRRGLKPDTWYLAMNLMLTQEDIERAWGELLNAGLVIGNLPPMPESIDDLQLDEIIGASAYLQRNEHVVSPELIEIVLGIEADDVSKAFDRLREESRHFSEIHIIAFPTTN